MVRNRVINFFLLISMIGILDAGYLTWSHLSGGNAGCFLIQGCDVVLKSQYATIFGMPVATLGLAYYLVVFIGVLAFNFNKSRRLIDNTSRFTVVGLLATLWFLYLQAFVLKAFCSYCLVSAVTSVLLFGLGMYILRILYKSNEI